MARWPRLVIPGHPVHLIQRGNNRTPTFHASCDFERYRDALYEASRRYGCAIHAYVLMTNHVHLLLTPDEHDGPSRMMQTIGRRYVQYLNARRHRTGTLWEGRFRSSLIDSERYFLACSRYVELNPVRARIVATPGQYRWSSHRHNAHGDVDALVTPHALYQELAATPADRQTAYRALFHTPVEQQTLDGIRRATNAGVVLGTASFCEHVEATLQHRVRHLPRRDYPSALLPTDETTQRL